MPPQIKQDLNRSGWESTDFPSVCENCLPDNPYVKMLKEDYGAECKLCTRPFTVFSWSADRTRSRKKRTNICLTCARLKNCCQTCLMDLSFGLPVVVRDAALKMVAPGPQSDINREYFAQNNERAIENGQAGLEVYDKTDEKATELLSRLATSKSYFRKGRPIEADRSNSSRETASSSGNPAIGVGDGGQRPIRVRGSRTAAAMGAVARGKGRVGSLATIPLAKDWQPPADKNITSLFITGVEDDLPEYKIRDHFRTYGQIKSLVCSHMSHCAFINYETRDGAEKAAAAFRGRTVIAGCPLRVRWGHPRAVGTMNKKERRDMIRDGQSAFYGAGYRQGSQRAGSEGGVKEEDGSAEPANSNVITTPPGADQVKYASLQGD